MSYEESVRLRQNDDDLQQEMTKEALSGVQAGGYLVVRTATQGSYPTAANRFYHCEIESVLGTETEGSSATFDGASKTIKAYNLGSGIPPVGTRVIACHVPYSWVFQYP